jgi:hypothetical protein
MAPECDHKWVTVAWFEARGCEVEQCVRCYQSRTTWLTDAHVVPVDPMDDIDTDCCQ